jgi:Ca2+-binding RTX toxin-like protein
MKPRALLLAAALALLVSATALADNTIDPYPEGNARMHSEDPSVNGNYVISVAGADVSFFEDQDPQGTQNYPFDRCRPGRTVSGRVVEVLCPKSSLKTIALEPGAGEDKVKYTVNDIPGALSGGTGADKAEFGDAADDLAGEQGNDTLSAGGGDDIVNGDEGNDTLDGGAGNDKITGGTGTDTITAGVGDDTVLVADGLEETIDCGEGTDTVTADAQDKLTACENVTLQNVAAPTEQPTGDDKVRPKVEIGGSSSQKLGKSVRFAVTCSEKGLIQAVGVVDAGGISDATKGVTRKVTVGGGGVIVKLKLLKRHQRNIRKDFAKHRKPRVKVILSCVDNAGNTSRARRFWISLRKR